MMVFINVLVPPLPCREQTPLLACLQVVGSAGVRTGQGGSWRDYRKEGERLRGQGCGWLGSMGLGYRQHVESGVGHGQKEGSCGAGTFLSFSEPSVSRTPLACMWR